MANFCSDGSRVSQQTIERKFTEAKRDKHEGMPHPVCEAYGDVPAEDNDHTISQKRCKHLGKSELIWDPENFVSSSRRAHNEWEEWTSGKYLYHDNCAKRMRYLFDHDEQSFTKRTVYDYRNEHNEQLLVVLNQVMGRI